MGLPSADIGKLDEAAEVRRDLFGSAQGPVVVPGNWRISVRVRPKDA